MAMIKCPECGREISDTVVKCPHCGYGLKKEVTAVSDISNKKKRYIGIVMCVFACMLFVFALKNITNSKYKFYVENYDIYVAGYEQNANTASQYSSGIFRNGYSQIASGYKDMAEDAKRAIWSYRIKSIASCGVGVFLMVFGIKDIRKNKEI